MTDEVEAEEGDSSRGPRKFVLCGGVRDNRSGVGPKRTYENPEIQKNTLLSKLFLTHTHPSHSKASLFYQSPSDFSGTPLLSLEQVDLHKFILILPSAFTLTPILPLTPESLQKSTPPPEATTSLYLRCDSCHSRQLYSIQKLSASTPCKNCGKDLTIYHWTGRCGKANTTSIIDITSAFTQKYLTTAGFIMRKFNLWVHDARGIMCYVDFRGRKIPSTYAFSDAGGVSHDKLPSVLIKVRRELIPYLERPTSADISKRRSRQTQVLSTTLAPDPLELQVIIDELTNKGVDVLAHLKELNSMTVSKELNNESDINKPKCPSCNSTNFSIVENKLGKAERCSDCDYLKITGDEINAEESDRGNGNEGIHNSKGTQSVDDSFF